MGFKTKTIRIKNDEKQLVEMREDATICFPSLDYYLPFKIYELEDYSENWQTTQDITFALSKISGIRINDGHIFSSPSIRMRGDNNTIVVVDGVRYDMSILNSLNPADVEHIAVTSNVAASNYFRTH